MDRAESSNNRTHQYTGSMNYELPFGKGRKWLNRGGIINAIFGGFDMVYLYRIQSGDALTFGFGGSPYPVHAGRGGRPRRPAQFDRASAPTCATTGRTSAATASCRPPRTA